MKSTTIQALENAMELIDASSSSHQIDMDLLGDTPWDDKHVGLINGEIGLTNEENAVLECLHASRILLAAVQKIKKEPMGNMSPSSRIHRLNYLVSQTKAAGRASYRAALLLTGMDAGEEPTETLMQQARQERSRVRSDSTTSLE